MKKLKSASRKAQDAKTKSAKRKAQEMIVPYLKRTSRIALWLLGLLVSVVVVLFIYANFPVRENENPVPMGVTFSARYATDIGLDWRETYLAMLDDLKMRKIRIPVYWDLVEKSAGSFDFSDLDWQLAEAGKRGAKITLVMGQKVPRWPECFIPEWFKDNEAERKEKQVAFVQKVAERYKNNAAIERWQVENEPFLDFGICPVMDPALLDREIAAVKKTDAVRPLVVTDSGELSLWLKAASRADIFGTTMYREVYSARKIFGYTLGHWRYPIGPNFFKLKRLLISFLAKQDNVVVIELQGEPWVQGWTVHAPLATQLASMNADVLKDNYAFAKKTGVGEVYVWGVEWWYWLKKEHNDASVWEAAKELNEQNAI